MWIPYIVWLSLQRSLNEREADLRKAYERIDRLSEALAHKADIPLVMPQVEPRIVNQILEKSATWFDNRPHVIPNSGEKKQ
jgi:hypothetical protein